MDIRGTATNDWKRKNEEKEEEKGTEEKTMALCDRSEDRYRKQLASDQNRAG